MDDTRRLMIVSLIIIPLVIFFAVDFYYTEESRANAEFIFKEGIEKEVKENFIADFPRETSVCIYGTFNGSVYYLNKAKRAYITYQSKNEVRFKCKPLIIDKEINYLIMDIHSHPSGNCFPSKTDLREVTRTYFGITCNIEEPFIRIFDI